MRLLPFVCVLAACHAAPQPVPKPAPSGVTGHVTLAPGAKATATRGGLFVTWMTVPEQRAFTTGAPTMQLLRDFVTRGVVVRDADVRGDVAFTIHPGHGKVVLVALVDVGHLGIVGAFGFGSSLMGMSAPFDVTDATTTAPPITVISPPDQRPPEACVGPQLTLEHIDAPKVAGTVGNSTSRRICVRVPKGYADNPDRHYPVIYALPGLAGDDSIIRDLPETAAIVVAVDTSTKTGSTYLVDSPTSGAWDTFFTTTLIPYVDSHYRTLRQREARALAGHSTGGFNAMSYALRHPDVVGVVGSSSPDGLDFELWLGSGHVPPWIREFQRVEHELGGGGQFISYAADWSPSASGYDWPFDAAGALVPAVAARWLANTPAVWMRDPKRVAAAKPLSGHIYLTVGDTDEFDLHAPTVAFSKQLTDAGIANELVVTHGGHVTHEQDQMAATFAFCSSKLAAAR